MKSLRNERGQSLVEFAIILPILLVIIMGIIEFGMMMNSYLAISNASREGARIGIVGSSDIDIKNLIIATSPSLDTEDLVVNISPSDGTRISGDTLTVKVTYNYQLTVPIISIIFHNVVVLNAQTSMRIE